MRIYFIHGFLENPKMWDFAAELSSEKYFLSLPGHGDRIMDSCPDNMTEIGQIILQDIDTSKPYAIIGHSMGGYLLGELVSLGARPEWIGMFHSKFRSDNEAKKAQRARAIELVVENKNLYMRTMISNLFSDAFKVKKYHLIDQLVEEAFQIHAETVQNCQRAMMQRQDRIELIETLQIPVHYFAGNMDTSVTIAEIEQEHLKIKNSHLQIIEDIGHMGQWECPELAKQWINSLI